MEDKQNNLIDCFRVRLTFLEDPLNKAVWQGEPPVKFTQKATLARTLLAEIDHIGGRQSLRITGATADKDREETDLEITAHTLGRALVIFAHDNRNETLAARYDLPLRGWSRLRDEQLLEKARQLLSDATAASTDEVLQPVATTRVAERRAMRDGLPDRVNTEVGRILATRNVDPNGRTLDRQFLGRTNRIVLTAAIHRRINSSVGRGAGERSEFSRGELEQINENFQRLVDAACEEVFNGH